MKKKNVKRLKEIDEFTDGNSIIIDGEEGTKLLQTSKLTSSLILKYMDEEPKPVTIDFNTTYRGDDLTSLYGPDGTAEYNGKTGLDALSAKLQAGDVSDLYIGDYITVPIDYYAPSYTSTGEDSDGHGIYSMTFASSTTNISLNWVIAAFDYYRKENDASTVSQDCIINPHSIMMIPSNRIPDIRMNLSSTTKYGYVGSHLYGVILGSRVQTDTYDTSLAKAVIDAFGETHVLTHKRLLTNSINTSGVTNINNSSLSCQANNFSWHAVELCLLNEMQVHGKLTDVSSSFDIADSNSQVPLFNLNSSSIVEANSDRWWLSTVVTPEYFGDIYLDGSLRYRPASLSAGVRPYFLFV